MMTSKQARSTKTQARTARKRPYILLANNDEHRVLTDDDDYTLKGRPRCHGQRSAGGRCRAFAGYSGWCFNHDPETTPQDRREARAMSGPGNRLVKLMPPRLRPVFEDLVGAMKDLRDGRITPSQASALSALATAAVRVLTSGELEERLRALDAATATDDDMPPPPYADD
jgi:hypothetical protein